MKWKIVQNEKTGLWHCEIWSGGIRLFVSTGGKAGDEGGYTQKKYVKDLIRKTRVEALNAPVEDSDGVIRLMKAKWNGSWVLLDPRGVESDSAPAAIAREAPIESSSLSNDAIAAIGKEIERIVRREVRRNKNGR